MKPFNLQAAIAGAKLQTRDGREVTEIHFFETATDEERQPFDAVIGGRVLSFTKEGKFWVGPIECNNDLFIVAEKTEYWVNVYRNKGSKSISAAGIGYPSKEFAFWGRAKDVEYLGDPLKIWEEEV